MRTLSGMAAIMILASVGRLTGQATTAESMAHVVLSELPALDAAPNLGSWRLAHIAERLKAPAYDNEYETQGLWCAASVADIVLPGGVKAIRMAFFYVPPRASGAALPSRQDPHLVQQCRLRALWYQLDNPADPAGPANSVSKELTGLLGFPEALSRYQRRDHDWGPGDSGTRIWFGRFLTAVLYWLQIREGPHITQTRSRVDRRACW